MMLKFWGEWKLLPQSAFKVYSFWYSIQKDKLSQYAAAAAILQQLAANGIACFAFVIAALSHERG